VAAEDTARDVLVSAEIKDGFKLKRRFSARKAQKTGIWLQGFFLFYFFHK
jgi:hypothetical protein